MPISRELGVAVTIVGGLEVHIARVGADIAIVGVDIAIVGSRCHDNGWFGGYYRESWR